MPIAIRRVLLATDFSSPANHALEYACVLADKFGAQLHVLHVVAEPSPMPPPEGFWVMPAEVTADMIRKAEQDLARNIESQRLSYGGQPVCAVRIGYPIDQILSYVADNDIDLVVVGTQGHRGLAHALLGSVAEKIVRLATCPVLTVHPASKA